MRTTPDALPIPIMDQNGHQIMSCVFGETGDDKTISLKSGDGSVLGFVRISNEDYCRVFTAHDEHFGYIRKDWNTGKYVVTRTNGTEVVYLYGVLHEMAINITSPEPSARLLGATEPWVDPQEPGERPYFKVRLAPKCDAGVAVLALVTAIQLESQPRGL